MLRAHWRTIGLAVAAVLLLSVLAYLQARPSYPTGSAQSADPDGTKALLLWLQAQGVPATRRVSQEMALVADGQQTVFVIQPQVALTDRDAAALDGVVDRGGTLVVASNAPQAIPYLKHLGVTLDYAGPSAQAQPTDGSPAFAFDSYSQVSGDGLEPLLRREDGGLLAARKPYRDGTLLVLADPGLLANQTLRDDTAADFVYRTIVQPASGGQATFDETHYVDSIESGPEGETLQDVVFQSAVGRALLFAGGVVFLYLLLGSRRLGPPLPAVRAEAVERSMYEYVQAMASLYRRARQLPYARGYFADLYRRRLGSGPDSQPLAERIAHAANDRALLEAVRAAEQAAGTGHTPVPLRPTNV